MSNIKYNKEQEAYELPYKMWDKPTIVRFYADSEEEIMENLRDIAMKIETINGGKEKLARMLSDDGLYEGSAEILAKELELDNIYVDIDEDDIVVCFTVSSADGYMRPQDVELFDEEFEIVDNSF